MSKYKNMKQQLGTALHQGGVHERGFDRHAAKAAGAEMKISSDSTWDKTKRTCAEFAQYCQHELGVRDASRITQADYVSFIMDKAEAGVRDSSCQNYITLLQYVERARAKHLDQKPADLQVARDLAHAHADRSQAYPTRAYADPEAVIGAIRDPEVQGAVALQYSLGARANGIKGMTEASFRGKEVVPALGVEMGRVQLRGKGKDYQTLVPADVYDKAKAYVESMGQITVTPQEMRAGVREACDSLGIPSFGTHGFRHNAAQDTVTYWSSKIGADAAKALASETLGHHRPEIVNTYLR